jgi:hypothetical protein
MVYFSLKMERIDAPGWAMTFADIADDLEALYYAALFFDNEPGVMPGMDVTIHRYRTDRPKFLAARAKLQWTKSVMANATASQ